MRGGHIFTRMNNLTAFDGIVACWQHRVRCEIGVVSGGCGRPARYHVTCHECGRGLVCRRHLRMFLRQLNHSNRAECNRCGRQFASIDDAVTVVKL